MVKIPDRVPDSGLSGYYRGMNTLDDPLTLKQGECQLLENVTPLDPLTSREALVDIFTDSTVLGYGGNHTKYTPGAAYILGPDGKEYVFALSKNDVVNRYNNNVAMSSNGTKRTITDTYGYVYVSTDSGSVWTKLDSVVGRHCIAMSSNGTIQTVTSYGGYIYVSTDSGSTWTQKGDSRNWVGIAMSSNGAIQTAVVYGGYIYVSTDSGATWTQKGTSGNWVGIAMSSSGAIQTAVAYGGYIYVSTDSGSTWTQKGTSQNWNGVAMSSDGAIQTAVVYDGYIYVSTDSGSTWTQKGTQKNWGCVAMSSSGAIQTAVAYASYIYVSTDSGSTWTQKGTSGNWVGVAMSSSGASQIAISPTDVFWISTDSGSTWVQSQDGYVYNLETLNITSQTRTVLMSALFTSVTHCNMLKIYNSIYLLFDSAITANFTHPYLKKNMIIYWTGTTWTLRAWGIDCTPVVSPVQTGDAELARFSIDLVLHTSLVFKNKMWVIGGYNFSSRSKKVYSSFDGVVWTEAGTDSLPYTLMNHSSVVFKNKMWIIGGLADGTPTKKVYSSDDGITWTEAGTDALPQTIYYHSSLVYNNKMWVIGGAGGSSNKKIYSSSDGITWVEAGTDSLPNADGLIYLATLIYNNKMWIIGGSPSVGDPSKKVYYSTDGIAWSEAGTDALPVGLSGHTSVVYDNKMWVIGGNGTVQSQKVYYSTDGITWAESGTDVLPSTIALHTSIVYNSKVWNICGEISSTPNKKIYQSSGALTTWTQQIGGIVKDYWTSIAFTFVRRTTQIGYDTPIFEDAVDESMEDTTQRQLLKMMCSTTTGTLLIPMPDPTNAIAQGSTHMRVWRTLGDASATVAAGLTHRYLLDISLTAAGFSQATIYHDITPDSALTYESHIPDTTGYEVPPAGRFAVWDQERIWLSTGNGSWVYSRGASTNVAAPQKYASIFQQTTQKTVFEPYDGQRDTGAFIFQGDLYFCKEQKIGILDNHDPANIPRVISHEIGIDFPNAISFVDHPVLKQVVFGLSHKYPIVIRSGGFIEALESMPLSELWNDGLIHVDASTGLARSSEWKETVTSVWHKDSWRILVPGQTIPTLYCFSASPDGKYIGSFIDTLAPGAASAYQNDPVVLIPRDGNVCYGLSDISRVYRIFNFLKTGVFQDVYGSTSYSYHLKIKTRRLGLDTQFSIMGELSDFLVFCDLTDTAGLSFTCFSDGDRFECPVTYTEVYDSNLSTFGKNYFRKMLQVILKEGFYGRSFDILIDKTCPSTGSFKFRGLELHIEPQPDFGAEFYTESSAVENGWE